MDKVQHLKQSNAELRSIIEVISTAKRQYIQYNTVQYSTEQYSTVQCNTIQYGAVQYSTVQYGAVYFIHTC